MSEMKLIMESWKNFEEKEILKEQVDNILFLFEDGNEHLLEEAMLNEGAIWDFIKNAASFPQKMVTKVIDKGASFLNKQLKKRGVKRVTRNNVIATVKSENNKKLAVATVFALIALAMSAAFGADIAQFVESLGNSTVTQIYQAIDGIGDAKDMAISTLSLPAFGLASLIPGLKDKGLGTQSAGIKGL